MILTCSIREPGVLVRHGGPQQVHNDPGEVYVDDHHDIELPEQLQLQQIARCLPVGLRKQAQLSARISLSKLLPDHITPLLAQDGQGFTPIV